MITARFGGTEGLTRVAIVGPAPNADAGFTGGPLEIHERALTRPSSSPARCARKCRCPAPGHRRRNAKPRALIARVLSFTALRIQLAKRENRSMITARFGGTEGLTRVAIVGPAPNADAGFTGDPLEIHERAVTRPSSSPARSARRCLGTCWKLSLAQVLP